MNKNVSNNITELNARDVPFVHGGKCMFCKWLNDHVGKPVFEKGGREAIRVIEKVMPAVVISKAISSNDKKEESESKNK